MSTKLIQIVIEHDGQLCQLAIPAERKQLALRLLLGVFDDGVMAVVRLPKNIKVVPLSELGE